LGKTRKYGLKFLIFVHLISIKFCPQKMTNRPQIEKRLTKFDKAIEILGYTTLIALWIMTIVAFSSLPESIPIHYNGYGEVDNYSSKTSIFLLPIFGTFLFTILTLLNKYPENFNYNVKITEENAEQQYTNSTRMMRFLKFIVLVIFFIIDFQTIQIANSNSDKLGVWFLPLVLAMIFIPIGYFAYKSYKLNKQ